MDSRVRQLERRAASGDAGAEQQLAHLGCQMGEHVLRADQIILSDNNQRSISDVGCCQCGKELYNAQQLCEKGHHRLFWDPWSNLLEYWCIRPGYHKISELRLALHRAYLNNDFSLGVELEQQLSALIANPYTHAGCAYHLKADEACSRGMHFLHITPQGRACRNPNCKYMEADACSHPNPRTNLHLVHSHQHQHDADGREVVRCGRCEMAFYDADICSVFGHRPDEEVDNPCIRPGCPSNKPGMSLYEALAAAYRAGQPLSALAREKGRTLAVGSGWNEKLRALGVKKPKASEQTEVSKVGPQGRMLYKVMVKMYERQHYYPGELQRLSRWKDYTTITESLKTAWAGKWYPQKGA